MYDCMTQNIEKVNAKASFQRAFMESNSPENLKGLLLS